MLRCERSLTRRTDSNDLRFRTAPYDHPANRFSHLAQHQAPDAADKGIESAAQTLFGHAGQIAADGTADDLHQQVDEHFHDRTSA